MGGNDNRTIQKLNIMKVLVGGDFCPRDRVAALFEKEEYSVVLDKVRPLISSVDYSIVNFECPVCDNTLRPIDKCGPNLRCSIKGLNALKYAGFSCVTLANNHFRDFGDEGIKETLQSLNKLSIDHVGGGMDSEEASQILFKEINGQTLAIISCCEHEFSIAKDSSAGSNPLNPIQLYYTIKRARDKADRVLMIIHGGHEHFQLPSPRMVETYRFFIDAGADAVVNHHQHCYSGYELYQGKPIFYGLGNFCFDNPDKQSGIWTEGYLVTLDFSCQNPSFEIHPYKQCAEEPSVCLLEKGAFDRQFEKLNTIISNERELQKAIESYYTLCNDQYSSIFEPIQNRFYLAAKRRGWLPSLINKQRKLIAANFVICEAHRDKLIHWLEK